eukprot:684165-Rhodomonas_salina.2
MHKIEKVLASAKIPAHRVEHEMQTTLPDGFKSQFAPSRPRQNHGSMRRRLTTRGSGSSINVGQPSFEASSLPASPGAAARAGGGDWSPVAGIPRAATTGFSSRVSSDESEGWSVAARLDEFARAISAGRIMMPSMPGLRGARAATGPLFRQSRRLNGTLLPPKRKSQVRTPAPLSRPAISSTRILTRGDAAWSQVRTQPVTSLSLLYKQAFPHPLPRSLQPLATASAPRVGLPVHIEPRLETDACTCATGPGCGAAAVGDGQGEAVGGRVTRAPACDEARGVWRAVRGRADGRRVRARLGDREPRVNGEHHELHELRRAGGRGGRHVGAVGGAGGRRGGGGARAVAGAQEARARDREARPHLRREGVLAPGPRALQPRLRQGRGARLLSAGHRRGPR